MTISPLAKPSTVFGRSMFSGRGGRTVPLYGVMLHTTGQGVPNATAKTSEATLRKATEIYTRSGGPHYVIGWDGTIIATVADERIRGAHAGITDAGARNAYAAGRGWESRVSSQGAKLWHERWPGKDSPADIVPKRDLWKINDLWIGIEMIPITPGGSTYWAKPAYQGSRFTQAQHAAAKALADDIGNRHGFPSGWKAASEGRLVGHSDLNPIARDSAALPLWDPGYHTRLFDMDYVRGGNWGWLIAGGVAIAAGLFLSRYIR